MASPPGSPPSIRVRKHATTRELPGSEYEEEVDGILDPPRQLQRMEEYTVPRVRQGLKYADSTLRNPLRELSPMGRRGLAMYKEACAKFLDLEEGGAVGGSGEASMEQLKIDLIEVIRTREGAMQYDAFKKRLTSKDPADVQWQNQVWRLNHIRRVEWESLVAEWAELHRLVTAYIEEWGSMDLPPALKLDSSLDSDYNSETCQIEAALSGKDEGENSETGDLVHKSSGRGIQEETSGARAGSDRMS